MVAFPTPTLIEVAQWTIVVLEVLVLAWLASRLARRSGLRRLLAPVARLWRPAARPARLVAAAEEAPILARTAGGPPTQVPRTGASVRSPHTPRAVPSVPAPARATPIRGTRAVRTGTPGPAAGPLHCPRCAATLPSPADAPLLLTRCGGCGARISARMDGTRLVVTVEEA